MGGSDLYSFGCNSDFTLLDAIATVDVLAASSNDVNFVETQTVHFA